VLGQVADAERASQRDGKKAEEHESDEGPGHK